MKSFAGGGAMSNIYEKLQQARVNLQNQNLKKSGKNSYSGFTYYELADFIPQVNNIFLELKLCSNFSIKENIAYLDIINAEKPEERTVFTMPTAELTLKGCTAIQALGGINTYCRRYLYLNALEIVESDMLDPNAGKIKEEPKPKKQPSVIENNQAPEGFIGQEEKEILKKNLGMAEFVKEMNACSGKMPFAHYYELLEGVG